ncbi:hypothetical protein JW960_27655 [candidate division KSB1 bacterium]|nr:hypothetical protein [candidate division KSB1 bacterium]
MKLNHIDYNYAVPKMHFQNWFSYKLFILKNRGVSWGARFEIHPQYQFLFGKGARLEKGVVINNYYGDVHIHEEVHTGIGCVIIGPVEMHKHVGLSQYVTVLGIHQEIDQKGNGCSKQMYIAPIVLEEDAFVGTGTVIQGKSTGEVLTLGKYCRIGANSLVIDDIPPYAVAVGNPAKVVRLWNHEKNCWVKA